MVDNTYNEMMEALHCLNLEAPAAVVNDVQRRVRGAFAHVIEERTLLKNALEGLLKHFEMANGTVVSIVSKQDVENARIALQYNKEASPC